LLYTLLDKIRIDGVTEFGVFFNYRQR